MDVNGTEGVYGETHKVHLFFQKMWLLQATSIPVTEHVGLSDKHVNHISLEVISLSHPHKCPCIPPHTGKIPNYLTILFQTRICSYLTHVSLQPHYTGWPLPKFPDFS